MSRTRRSAMTLITGLLLAAALVYAGLFQPRPAFDPLAAPLFTVLFLFTDALAIPVGVGYVNLDAIVAVGALLVMGPFAAALIALVGAAVNIGVRWAFPERVGEAREPGGLLSLINIGLTNAFLMTVSLVGGAALYEAAGGPLPLVRFGLEAIGPYLLLVLGYSVINYSAAAVYVMLPGDRSMLDKYLRALPTMSAYEILPQLFTPLLPLIYTGLGPGPFLVFSLAVAGGSMVLRAMAVDGQRPGRRGGLAGNRGAPRPRHGGLLAHG